MVKLKGVSNEKLILNVAGNIVSDVKQLCKIYIKYSFTQHYL